MSFIVDASVAVLWLIDTPTSKIAEPLLRRAEPIIAPDLLIPEIANALWKFVAFAELPSATAQTAIEAVDSFFSEIVSTHSLRTNALSIAIELKHPAYDCFYLALAEERSCFLITADERLLRRCKNTRFGKLVRPLA